MKIGLFPKLARSATSPAGGDRGRSAAAHDHTMSFRGTHKAAAEIWRRVDERRRSGGSSEVVIVSLVTLRKGLSEAY
jgi:hypothetical protein